MQKWWNNEELARKVASHAFAFFGGCMVGTGMGLYALGAYQERINDRHKKIANCLDEGRAIMNDITLSGEERERKAEELYQCAVMLMREDLF